MSLVKKWFENMNKFEIYMMVIHECHALEQRIGMNL